jgi:hypothetical protein
MGSSEISEMTSKEQQVSHGLNLEPQMIRLGTQLTSHINGIPQINHMNPNPLFHSFTQTTYWHDQGMVAPPDPKMMGCAEQRVSPSASKGGPHDSAQRDNHQLGVC